MYSFFPLSKTIRFSGKCTIARYLYQHLVMIYILQILLEDSDMVDSTV